MHTIELLEQALDLVQRLGYAIRRDWLAGNGGGGCELKGQKLFFLDLDLAADEQLERVLETIRREPEGMKLPMSRELRQRLDDAQEEDGLAARD
jgi:hypothetical protein